MSPSQVFNIPLIRDLNYIQILHYLLSFISFTDVLYMTTSNLKKLRVRYNGMLQCYCPLSSVIEELWVNAVHLVKLYAFADGFNINIYITLHFFTFQYEENSFI